MTATGYEAPEVVAACPADTAVAPRSGFRRVLSALLTAAAYVLLWCALAAPNELGSWSPAAFVRIPVEGLVVAAVVLVLPGRWRRAVAVVVGVVLGLLTVVKLLDLGFVAALDRPFDPVSDWAYLGPAFGVLSDSIGRTGAVLAVVGLALLVLALIVLMPLSALRVTGHLAHHRARSVRSVAAFGLVWILGAAFDLQIADGAPLASGSAAALVVQQVQQVRAGLQDQQSFAAALAHDPVAITPANDLLTALRGKDVVVVFVESYGRVAVQGSAFSDQVDAVLEAGTNSLRESGFAARSAFLTSPTFGGISWLAHSTLQSGLWIDNQARYDQLVAGDRFTLSDAFHRAGWRTVGDVPSNFEDWPEGSSFYHYDQIYDGHNVGYQGPSFSYADMPDEYVLSAFQRMELAAPGHTPVMAEIDLVSSHTPWAPLPSMVPWGAVGNGSVFDSQPAAGQSPTELWRDATAVGAAYGQSIEYSMNALISFVQNVHDNNMVLVVLGDHQPGTIVSGTGASHDVPISIISHDPAVLNRIAGWGWQSGLTPGPQAPVWPMSAFRDRFLSAYGP